MDTPFQSHSDTSKAAAAKARSNAFRGRQVVKSYLLKCGHTGATDEEIQFATELNPSTERPRRIELVDNKEVFFGLVKRNTSTGSPANVWVAAECASPRITAEGLIAWGISQAKKAAAEAAKLAAMALMTPTGKITAAPTPRAAPVASAPSPTPAPPTRAPVVPVAAVAVAPAKPSPPAPVTLAKPAPAAAANPWNLDALPARRAAAPQARSAPAPVDKPPTVQAQRSLFHDAFNLDLLQPTSRGSNSSRPPARSASAGPKQTGR